MNQPGTINSFAALMMVLLLSACGDPVQSIDYYVQHDDALTAALKKCRSYDLPKKMSDQNCINANRAYGKLMFK